MNKQEAISILKEHNQEHVIKRLEALEDDAAKKLISQVAMIDWKVVVSINDKSDSSSEDKKIEPLEAVEIKDIKANKEKYTAKGVEAIKNGKVAAVLLAGGQGTRLGLDKPKGTLNVGVNKDLFLFGQLIRNLLDVVDMTGAYVPLYIMTSDKNNEDTVAFFEEHNYFGYDKDYVKFFIQSMVPSVDYNGKLYMESTDSLAMSPNGNGGWFLSLMAAGLDKDMEEKGVEYVNVFAVDNILQRIADPAFIGATMLAGAECGSKVVRKCEPEEKVGVMCRVNGHPSIIEYYEMSEELANLRREDGELTYGFGVILNYLFSFKKLVEISNTSLPLHIVEKKIPYMVEMMDNCVPYEVERSYEFAPIKNKTGKDSLESARELLKVNGIEF